MFNLTKLSPDSQSFLTQVASSGRSRSAQASIALARMIGMGFSIPSAPVEDVEAFYRMQCQIKAESIVSKINELSVLDTTYVLDMCRSFFKWRYQSAHPSDFVASFIEGQYIEDFFDITKVFSKETLELIKCNGGELAFYVNGFRKIVRDMDEAENQVVEQINANNGMVGGL